MKKFLFLIQFIFTASLLFSQKTDSAQFYFNKGIGEKTASHYHEASKNFESALKFNEKYTEAYIENARVSLQMRRMDAAQGNFAKALELQPGNAIAIKELTSLYFNNHQYQKAIDLAAKCKNCADTERIIAFSNFYLEEYSKAINGLQRVIVKNPKDTEAVYILAKSLVEMDEYANAITQFQKAISLDSTKNVWQYELGLLYYSQQDFPNAVKYLNAAANAGFKKSNDFYENLGHAYLYAGDFDNGMKYLNIILEKKPNSKDLLRDIAFAYYKSHRFDDALKYYEKLLDKDPQDAKSLYMKGMCFIKKGDKETGKAICDNAIAIDPSLKGLKQAKVDAGL